MEVVIVKFPTSRLVYVDDEKNGKTNQPIYLDAGTHKFDLGPRKNYTPESQQVAVSGTSVLDPLEIAFSRKPGTG